MIISKIEANKRLRQVVIEASDIMKRVAVVNVAIESKNLTDTAISQLQNEVQAINFKIWDIQKLCEKAETPTKKQ